MGADLAWVEPQVLEAKHGVMEAKEGNDVSAGHVFGGCASDGKVQEDGGFWVCVVLAEAEEASGRRWGWVSVFEVSRLRGGELAPGAVLLRL